MHKEVKERGVAVGSSPLVFRTGISKIFKEYRAVGTFHPLPTQNSVLREGIKDTRKRIVPWELYSPEFEIEE